MTPTQAILLSALGGYVSGATPFGYLAGKLTRGIDIRQHGSGNIGATNAIRVLGKGIGIPVFILDFLKPAVWLAKEWWRPCRGCGVARVHRGRWSRD